MNAPKPNVLLIMSDSHTQCAMSANGSAVRTPALDRLAAESVVFNRCICNAPVCGPSRFAFLTGKFVHNCGAYDNASTLPIDQPTVGHLMTAAGYRTVFVGRMHLHGANQMIGFEERPVHDWINPVDAPPHSFWQEGELPEAPQPVCVPDKLATRDLPVIEYDDDVAAGVIDVLRTHNATDDRPLFLMAGFTVPHPSVDGREVYREAYDRYMGGDLDLPQFTQDDFGRLHPHMQGVIRRSGKQFWNAARQKTAAYFARIEYFDHLFAAIMEALDASGLGEDTVVIYTSDHGENMGYHGNWGKMNFRERALRVPLMIRTAGAQPRTIDRNVSLVDLFPTLAELSGKRVEYDLDGHSLLPMAWGEVDGRPNEAFSEYHGAYAAGSSFCIVSDQWKYCHYNHHEPELFDLQSDPNEQRDLAKDPAQAEQIEAMRNRLRRFVPDNKAVETAVRQNQMRRQLQTDAVRVSNPTQQRLLERIDAYRAERHEPWWDGGAYMAQAERQFTTSRQTDGTAT